MPTNWDITHDPDNPPRGCNGQIGESGRKRHTRHRTPICDECRAASAWYARERKRGGRISRPLKPCGTMAAATRHRTRGERVCLACAIAEARYHSVLRAKKRAAGIKIT